jgi:plastocyanin
VRRSRALFACAVASALMLAGPAAANSQEAPAPQAITKVKIVDFAFQPSTVSVSAGTMVGWKNFGAASHTSTSDDGRWDSGTIVPGGIFKVRFGRPGTYTYHCDFHPFMTGTVMVT